VRLILALLCAISLSFAGMARADDNVSSIAPSAIPKDWLDRKISIAEAEAEHPGIRDERAQRFPDAAKPFGFRNKAWKALKAAMQPGDELWTFFSPADSWKHLAGRAGIALVRDGNPIEALVTVMN
jgi:hypothetical protein